MAKFEIFRSNINALYYFSFVTEQGQQILSSEGFLSPNGCLQAITAVKARASFRNAYQRIENNGYFRFDMLSDNLQVIASSSASYATMQGLEAAIDTLKTEAQEAPVYEYTSKGYQILSVLPKGLAALLFIQAFSFLFSLT